MNLYSALELGKNSVLAQQELFQIIGHNIANVNTEGYSRQIADLESVRPSVIGLNDGGRGVSIAGIRSIRDRFINNQITERNQTQGKYDTLSSIMSTVETLFDESAGLGLSDSLTNFFKGWSDVANNPSDIPTRKSLISTAQSFAQTMNNTYTQLIDQQEVSNDNITTLVDEINSIANEIAELNVQIAYAEGANTPANDLLDTRESRLRDLSEKIGINFYYEQSNNSVTIEIGGRPLVSYNQVNELSVQRNQYNSNYYDVYMNQYGQPPINISTTIESGQMSALLQSRDGVAVAGAGQVTALAAETATTSRLTFSQAHGLNVGDLITINGETRSVISISSSTSVVVDNFSGAVATPSSWEKYEGYIPSYKRQLNTLAAGLVESINNLHQQGYALDTTTTDLNFFQMSNGTGAITAVAGNTVTFATNVSSTLSVGDVISIGGETRLVTGVTPGVPSSITVNTPFTTGVGAWQYYSKNGGASRLAVDAAIEADPELIAASGTVTPGAGAVGDNKNALQIARLIDSNTAIDSNNDGTADYGTFHDYLHAMMAEIGNDGQTAIYEADANESMLTYLQNKRDSVSGVSIDEESAQLLQLEKSFQALGKFMGTISDLTDVVLNLV